MKKNIIFFVLLFITVLQPALLFISQRDSYFSRGFMHDEYPILKRSYYSSQYVNKNPIGFLLDEKLEAFAGGIFLQGLNPILIVHDQPPLGRYIIAGSILLFDNPRTIPVILLFVSVVGLYYVGFFVMRNKFLALIPVGIFINEPMFLHKFSYIPLLEPIQLPFIVFAILCFIIGVQKKRYVPWFFLTSILIGGVISIRYFVLGAALTAALCAYLVLAKNLRKLVIFLSSFSLAVVVLFLSYFQTFKAGYSLIKVAGIQKYIFFYHKSAFVEPFSFWDLLLFNRWHTWWGTYAISYDPEWRILWPISVVIIVLGLLFFLFKKISLKSSEKIILLWIFVYASMLSAGYSSTRYFLPLIPFLYILATSMLVTVIYYFKKKKLQKK